MRPYPNRAKTNVIPVGMVGDIRVHLNTTPGGGEMVNFCILEELVQVTGRAYYAVGVMENLQIFNTIMSTESGVE